MYWRKVRGRQWLWQACLPLCHRITLRLVRQSPPCINAIVPIVTNNGIYLVKVVQYMQYVQTMHGGLCLTGLMDTDPCESVYMAISHDCAQAK